jgi:hypothetical protein
MPADDYKQITVYVSEKEKRKIERRAAAAEKSVSSYLADRGTADDERQIQWARVHREKVRRALENLEDQVAGIATNINQIAYHANRTKGVRASDARKAAKAAEQTADMIAETLEKIESR